MAGTTKEMEISADNVKSWSVQGKSAIVTGAGSGINFSFASLLLSQGCNVLIADLALRPEAEALLSQYPETSSNNARAVFHKTDVTSWPELDSMFAAGVKNFGVVDILCPGAGIYDPHWSNFWYPPGVPTGASRDSPTGGRYASLDINVTHPIRATQLALTHFLNPPAGVQKASPTNPKRVIIISSIAGQLANFHCPIYTAAKHAMNGFIRSLAPLEARYGIRVNGVAPGVIKTPLWTDHPEKLTFFDEDKDVWATPEEVAVAMVRCLEEKALGGGVILEVGRGQTRNVEMLNDPGPSGEGHTVSNIVKEWDGVYEVLEGGGWGVRGDESKL